MNVLACKTTRIQMVAPLLPPGATQTGRRNEERATPSGAARFVVEAGGVEPLPALPHFPPFFGVSCDYRQLPVCQHYRFVPQMPVIRRSTGTKMVQNNKTH